MSPRVPLLSPGVPLMSPGAPLLSPGVPLLSPGFSQPLLVSRMMPQCSCLPESVVCNLPPGILFLLVPAFFRILSPLMAAVYFCLLLLHNVMRPLSGHASRVPQGVLYTVLVVPAMLFKCPLQSSWWSTLSALHVLSPLHFFLSVTSDSDKISISAIPT